MNANQEPLGARRSWLFTPGTRPDRLDRAASAGADVLILDLEDSVAASDKGAARTNACAWLEASRPGRSARAVRINPPDTLHGLDDLAQLARAEACADYIIVPKAEDAGVMALVHRLHAHRPAPPSLVPLIESAAGLEFAGDIARAPGVCALMFGAADMAASLGAEVVWEALLHARSRVVQAAALAGVVAIDSPWFELADEAGMIDAAGKALRLGYAGKAAIHPKQIAIINERWTPSQEMVDRARRILAENPKGVGIVDGLMIDEAIARQARRVLLAAS